MTASWDVLHADPRHRLRYPSEHVVRFLAGLGMDGGWALDIGCGSGRHTTLLEEFGYAVTSCDVSAEALAGCDRASMTDLPYVDGLFDVAVAYGVFYYGSKRDGEDAVAEMHRVLKPGGKAFVCVRSNHDWRADGLPEDEPEHGMEMHFLNRDEIPRVYAAFSDVTFEMTSTSRGARWDSDWLITVTK